MTQGEEPRVEAVARPGELSPADMVPSLGMVLRGPNGLVGSLLLNGAAPLLAYHHRSMRPGDGSGTVS